MKNKREKRPPRIYVAIPTSGKDGQMRLAGIFRYLGGSRLWDLRLVQSRKDFTRPMLEEVLRGGMDGFIVAVPFSNDEIDFLAAAKLPIVVMTDTVKLASSGSRISRFFVDNAAIGRTAARYFLSRGQFKAFAYVTDTMQSQWSDERERAFKAAVGGHAPFLSFRRQPTHPEERILPADELGDWLVKLPKPAAVLVANDHDRKFCRRKEIYLVVAERDSDDKSVHPSA